MYVCMNTCNSAILYCNMEVRNIDCILSYPPHRDTHKACGPDPLAPQAPLVPLVPLIPQVQCPGTPHTPTHTRELPKECTGDFPLVQWHLDQTESPLLHHLYHHDLTHLRHSARLEVSRMKKQTRKVTKHQRQKKPHQRKEKGTAQQIRKKPRVVRKVPMKERQRKERFLPQPRLITHWQAQLGQGLHSLRKAEGLAGRPPRRALITRRRLWMRLGRHTYSR